MSRDLTIVALVAVLALSSSCSDSSSDTMTSTPDSSMTSRIDDLGFDAGQRDVAPNETFDGGGDSGADENDATSTSDAEPADSGAPVRPRITLTAADATATGRYSLMDDGRVILDPNGQLEWSYPPQVGGPRIILLKATIWRLEDSLVELEVDDETQRAMVRGDGTGRSEVARLPDGQWDAVGAGLAVDAPAISITLRPEGGLIRLRPIGGTIVIDALHLADPRDIEDTHQPPPTWIASETIEYSPCVDPECDDGLRLSELISTQAGERIEIILTPGQYSLKTPIRITRSWVRLMGAHADDPPFLSWDPNPGSGRRGAIEVQGPGLGDEASPLHAELAFGERRFLVQRDLPAGTRWVRVAMDDFGDIPPVCVDGRDVERYHRHQRQLARVLSMDGGQVTLDRPVALEAPVAANPRLVPVELLEGVEVLNLEIVANCPEAMNEGFSEASCANPEVLDDDGIMMIWTDRARIKGVTGRAFGKFTIQVRDALETLVQDCAMDHPAAYGSGGQGYGVHLIGASRTLVTGERVTHARHGVVVDFGSSDSQILDSTFSDMNQALVDVHGESSRDTLIRGNTMRNATIGVIIGGGGRAVHCNDEPRHHVERNEIIDCSIAAVSVSDYTREVTVRFNEMDSCSTFVIATFGARDIDVERNVLGESGITPITVALTDSGGVHVRRNIFTVACGSEDAFLALGEAEAPTFSENQFDCSPR